MWGVGGQIFGQLCTPDCSGSGDHKANLWPLMRALGLTLVASVSPIYQSGLCKRKGARLARRAPAFSAQTRCRAPLSCRQASPAGEHTPVGCSPPVSPRCSFSSPTIPPRHRPESCRPRGAGVRVGERGACGHSGVKRQRDWRGWRGLQTGRRRPTGAGWRLGERRSSEPLRAEEGSEGARAAGGLLRCSVARCSVPGDRCAQGQRPARLPASGHVARGDSGAAALGLPPDSLRPWRGPRTTPEGRAPRILRGAALAAVSGSASRPGLQRSGVQRTVAPPSPDGARGVSVRLEADPGSGGTGQRPPAGQRGAGCWGEAQLGVGGLPACSGRGGRDPGLLPPRGPEHPQTVARQSWEGGCGGEGALGTSPLFKSRWPWSPWPWLCPKSPKH